MENELFLEERIGRKISDIDNKIKELEDERRTLMRLLLDARREHAAKAEAVRVSSGQRILVENRILKALNRAHKPLSNSDLYSAALGAVYDLKASTFRSHIKRMKDAGKIVKSGSKWKLPD